MPAPHISGGLVFELASIVSCVTNALVGTQAAASATLLWLRPADEIRSQNATIWRTARSDYLRVPRMWRVAHRGRPVQVGWPHGRSCRASSPPPRECAGRQKPLHRHTGFGCGHGDHARHILGADGGAQDGIDLRQRSSCCIRCLRRPRWGDAAQSKCARCCECCRLLQNIAAGRGR